MINRRGRGAKFTPNTKKGLERSRTSTDDNNDDPVEEINTTVPKISPVLTAARVESTISESLVEMNAVISNMPSNQQANIRVVPLSAATQAGAEDTTHAPPPSVHQGLAKQKLHFKPKVVASTPTISTPYAPLHLNPPIPPTEATALMAPAPTTRFVHPTAAVAQYHAASKKRAFPFSAPSSSAAGSVHASGPVSAKKISAMAAVRYYLLYRSHYTHSVAQDDVM
jgi:hypothetical protein